MLKSTTPFRSLVALILLIASLFCSTHVTAQTAVQPQGAGTAASPYLISNWQELYWISQTSTSWDKQFMQTTDIDLALAVPSIKTWSSNTGWTPIGRWDATFSGNYDGGGYVINGLYINRPSSPAQALFGYTSATAKIHNLGVTGADVSGWVRGVSIMVGAHSGNISNCFTSGTVSAVDGAGGFVGNLNQGSRISNSFSRASVSIRSGTSGNIGGFAGSNYQGSITNCYSTGRVSYITGSSPTNKGFVGSANTDGNFSMSGNYWDTQSSGQSTTAGTASGKTTAEMKTQTTFDGWDFTTLWAIDPLINAGYPYLKNRTDNYSILKRAELELISSIATKNSIDFVGNILALGGSTSVSAHGLIINNQPQISLSPGDFMKGINLGTKSISGSFTGRVEGLEVSSLYYICAFATNEFGTIYTPVHKVYTLPNDPTAPQGSGDSELDPYLITNLSELHWIADQVNNQGQDFAGKYFLQVNDIDASETKNWLNGTGWEPIGNSSTSFTGTYDGNRKNISGIYIHLSSDYLGLFRTIGRKGSISNLDIVNVSISAVSYSNYAGTIAGLNNGQINNCYTQGDISDQCPAGGLVGINAGTISKCHSNINYLQIYGKQTGGGFVAKNNGIIENSYSSSTIFTDASGGFMDENAGTVRNCFCTGPNKNSSGFSSSGNGTVSNSFYVKNISGTTWDNSNAVGKTTAEMKSANTFINAGWDFKGETTNGTEDIWVIHPRYNNGYPFLIWEAPKLSYLGGSVYYDRDKNSAFSQGDVALGGIKVELLPEGTITGTARDGSYLFYTAPGDYTVRVIPKDPFYKGSNALEIPVSVKFLEDTVSAPIGLYGTDVYDFSLNMATVWTRCASKVPVWAIVQNKSILPTNIALNINLDPRVTLVSSTVPQDSTGTDGKKYFRLANMQPFESRVVELTVSVPAASTDSIFYSSSIQHKGKVVATDAIRNVIRCSYDPNEVQVIPGGLTENGYVPMGQELTYLVRFQNTGNDTAFMVDILDTLSPSLDPLSFEMLASSHEMRYFIERNGALRFLFEDINLEDSTSNEPASHGFVLFKVKPRATVTSGTRVGLTAHIYFDSNPAVVTNTAVTTFTDQYTKVAQSIDLTEGWNLVSFYVQPGDNAIENALSSCIADIEAVKTGDAFYSATQPAWLNSLKTINGGQAYLIKAKRDTKLSVNGLLVFKPFEHKLNKGWNMVGCPVKTDVAVDPMLKNKPVTSVKDFEGFWRPTTPAGNMINFEPGKGYFIFSDQPAVLPW